MKTSIKEQKENEKFDKLIAETIEEVDIEQRKIEKEKLEIKNTKLIIEKLKEEIRQLDKEFYMVNS